MVKKRSEIAEQSEDATAASAEGNHTADVSYGPHGCPYRVEWPMCARVHHVAVKGICEQPMIDCTIARDACLMSPGFQAGPCGTCKTTCARAEAEARRLWHHWPPQDYFQNARLQRRGDARCTVGHNVPETVCAQVGESLAQKNGRRMGRHLQVG